MNSRGGGGHSTFMWTGRGGAAGGRKMDPVAMRSVHKKCTLSQYTFTKNVHNAYTLSQYCTVAQWARMQLNCAKIIFYVIIFENWGFKGNLTRRIWLEYFQRCMTSSWYRFLIGRPKYEQYFKYEQLFSIEVFYPCVEDFFIHLFGGKFQFGHEFQ